MNISGHKRFVCQGRLLSLSLFISRILRTAVRYLPGLAGSEGTITFLRFGIASTVLVLALVIVHKWLPSGRRRISEIAPGIVVTLLLWMVSAFAFARYLAEFSGAYVRTYAGLASAMIALVFLYWTAGIFVYGGELNQAISRERQRGGGAP